MQAYKGTKVLWLRCGPAMAQLPAAWDSAGSGNEAWSERYIVPGGKSDSVSKRNTGGLTTVLGSD